MGDTLTLYQPNFYEDSCIAFRSTDDMVKQGVGASANDSVLFLS